MTQKKKEGGSAGGDGSLAHNTGTVEFTKRDTRLAGWISPAPAKPVLICQCVFVYVQ